MGASQTKQKSVLEQVTDIVNQTVNQSSTSIKASAKADQNMEISCSDKQMEIAMRGNPLLEAAYAKALDSYYKYGSKGKPPREPILLCTASGVSQNANVTLKTDAKALNSMAQQITNDLQARAAQEDKLVKTTPMVGYSQTDKETISKIITNVKNSTFNNNVLEIVNSAVVNQDMKISGSGVVNANQEATVSLISGAIIENITSNISKADLEIETEQDSGMEEKSGQVEAVKAVTDMIGGIFKGIMGMWIIFIIVLIGTVVMFPDVFCAIPPLRIPMTIMNLCSSKKSTNEQNIIPVHHSYPMQPGFNQFQQPGFNQFQQPGFNQFQQPGFNQFQQPGFNQFQQPGFNQPQQQGFNQPQQQGFQIQPSAPSF